jgi:peptide/nickel transport system permease protein
VRRRLAARALQAVIVVGIVTTISFFIIRLAPGDPFSYEGLNVTQAVRDHWRAQLGYDRPLPVQFLHYVSSVARGQLGYSTSLHRPVGEAILAALPNTLLLTGLSLALSFAIGITLGVVQATRSGGRFDRGTSALLMVLFTIPDFWLALMVLLIFGHWLPLFPAGGVVDPVMHEFMAPLPAFVDRLRHLVLPVASLTLVTLAAIARYQRAAMLEVLPADFVRAARARGLSERRLVWRHAFRTSLAPAITMLGLLIPTLLGGALFVEKVFGWRGIGLLTAEAISSRDYDLVTASVIVGAVLVTVGSFVADLLQMALDPRTRG